MIKAPIAIIGYACIAPGAPDAEVLWQMLYNNCETISHSFSDALINTGASTDNYIRSRGIIDLPTPSDFKFSTLKKFVFEKIHPQFWVFLKCCFKALDKISEQTADAKMCLYATSSLMQVPRDEMTGNRHDYHKQMYIGQNYLAGFISYILNISGPAVNVQTSCSSSLVAVIEACKELILENSEIALVGGVSVTFPQMQGYYYYPDDVFSKDGSCRPFSNDATGTVMSNGCGVVILKKLDKALKDRDTIHGIIRGYACNHDGNKKLSLTATSMSSQITLIKNALQNATLSPHDINYIETHGISTPLGDLIEYSALAEVFEECSQPVQIGSLKGNVGHLDVASGILSLIKALLILKNNLIPTMLNFSSLNQGIDPDLNIQPVIENTLFHPSKKFIGVSSFGMSGTNAHVILERS